MVPGACVMKLVVLFVGKLKDRHLEALCADYARRTFVTTERIACRDHAALWSRAEALAGPKVVLDERGELVTSEVVAKWLQNWQLRACRSVCFLIGDAHGFSEAERDRAERVLALSRLTFPHRLAQLVLCEQLYRAGTIITGHPYHHG